MKDIVIVPAFDRPELLALTLERIMLCSEAFWDAEIRVYVDYGAPLQEVQNVIVQFAGFLSMKTVYRDKRHGRRGNTELALAEAADTTCRFVFLIEEDVLVTPDFFRWHYAVQAAENPYCSVAGRSARTDLTHGFDTRHYYIAPWGKQQNGICWKREYLKAGCKPDSRIVFPYVPQAYHMGWYGHNRFGEMRFAGPLQTRIIKMKQAVTSSEQITSMQRRWRDVEPIPVRLPQWDGTLIREQQFE